MVCALNRAKMICREEVDAGRVERGKNVDMWECAPGLKFDEFQTKFHLQHQPYPCKDVVHVYVCHSLAS